jgi:hypothetical protein
MSERKWPKFSSDATTDKIEWWIGTMIVETLIVLQAAWAHYLFSEWVWFCAVVLSGARVWSLKNKLSYSVRLTGNKEYDDAALKKLVDLIREK